MAIKKCVDKETRDYCNHVKKISPYEGNELDNPLLHRHFFFKAIKEINNELSEDNAGFLVDITSDLHALFNQQTIVYSQKYWYYDLKKEIICLQLLGMDLYKLKSLVKDNEFLLDLKIKSNLPIFYVFPEVMIYFSSAHKLIK